MFKASPLSYSSKYLNIDYNYDLQIDKISFGSTPHLFFNIFKNFSSEDLSELSYANKGYFKLIRNPNKYQWQLIKNSIDYQKFLVKQLIERIINIDIFNSTVWATCGVIPNFSKEKKKNIYKILKPDLTNYKEKKIEVLNNLAFTGKLTVDELRVMINGLNQSFDSLKEENDPDYFELFNKYIIPIGTQFNFNDIAEDVRERLKKEVNNG